MQKHRPNRQVRRWVAVRQLGGIVRLILYDFVIPQSFFVLQKTTAPFTREPLTDSRKGCPYGMVLNSILIAIVSCYIFTDYLGGSKPLPYTIGYIIQSVRSTHFFSFFNFLSYLFSAVRLALSLRYDIYFHSVLSFFIIPHPLYFELYHL